MYERYQSNSYTFGSPLVRGDNPRALASGLSPVQAEIRSITNLNDPRQHFSVLNISC